MCGITGFHIKERYKGQLPVNEMLDYLLLHIQSRGEHATGFASTNFGGTGALMEKKDVKAEEFIQFRKDLPRDVQTVIGHTRFATQGVPEKNENNHPVLYGTCFAVHNGHIDNDRDVVKTLPVGTLRPAEVDSIAIPIALTTCGMGSIEEIKKGLETLQGGMATAAFDIQQPGQVLVAKGDSSPLYMLNHKYGYFWASTKDALDFMWGVMIGTPPTRTALTPNDLGHYQFRHGDAVLLNNGQIEQFDFTPMTRYSYYGASSWSSGTPRGGSTSSQFRAGYWDDEDDYGWGSQAASFDWDVDADGRTRIKRRIVTNDYIKTIRYTCSPSAANCSTPCEEGCFTHKCSCTETVYDFKDDFDRANDTSCSATAGDVYESVAAAHAALDYQEMLAGSTEEDRRGMGVGLITCASCNDWEAVENMYEYTMGSESFLLCLDCKNEWADDTVDVETDRVIEATTAIAIRTNDEPHITRDTEGELQSVYEEDEARHQYALFNCADSLEIEANFVDWILFKASMDELEKVPDMRERRELIDMTYSHFYAGMEG